VVGDEGADDFASMELPAHYTHQLVGVVGVVGVWVVEKEG
jgi:hypothetical protein